MSKNTLLSIYLLILAIIPSILYGDNILKAKQAMQAGNYAEAYCYWKILAQAGNAEAQYNLGWMYHNGYGLRINDKKSLLWWQEAAHQDYPDAIFSLAIFYYERGKKKDIPIALEYLLRSALLDNDEALLLLAQLISKHYALLRTRSAEIFQTYPTLFPQSLQIRKHNVNIRFASHTKSKVIYVANQGDTARIVQKTGKWYFIFFPQHHYIAGWVHGSLVKITH